MRDAKASLFSDLCMEEKEVGKDKDKNKDTTVYNIVDSVKGGCGKTTFAIMLSLMLDNYLRGDSNNDETVSCLIDMDIQGSALMYLLFGKTYLDSEQNRKTFRFLNDRVLAVEDTVMKYVQKFHFTKEKKTLPKPRFDVICCDPRSESKKKFRSMSSQNYSPEVLYSTFRMGLANMLSNIKKQMPYQHKQIIFDMPPNADGYSDAVYDVMLKKDYSVIEKDDDCNLFLMQTLDQGQCQATLDYFKELSASENFENLNKIFFVFNDWLGFTNGGKEDMMQFSGAVSYARDYISSNCGWAEELQEKIYFIGLEFNQAYYRLCTQTDGIQNAEMPVGLKSPVKYIQNFFKEEFPLTDKQLKKLLGINEEKSGV